MKKKIVILIAIIIISIVVVIIKQKENKQYENIIPNNTNDIFKDYYNEAINTLKTMSLEEKIAQTLLVRYPDNGLEVLIKYPFGGFVFFKKDFENKDKQEVQNMIKSLQDISKIPLLTAVDEEGGIVNRISTNNKLVSEPFKSSQQLYNEGGLEKIKEDTITKSKILSSLGINLNLAPVIDVSTNKDDYMYDRTIGQNTNITCEYAKTVIKASKEENVSYTLKHFPGYGNNMDTHTDTSIDNRTLEQIKKVDLPPFKTGIEQGAEAILISHNIVNSIDKNNPASLSKEVHKLLTDELNFSGIIITDAIDMGAISEIENVSSKALQAGNHLIITTDYEKSINDIKTAIKNKEISINNLNKIVLKILAWKYYKGLL